ncbi:MAG: hypothetical protein LLF76_11665 [Planctomycetaceae bacterium]|nr:hypothetical protein [Planctomycetaceae bacterium]
MSRKASAMLVVLGVCTAIILSGCGKPAAEAEMKLNFAPQQKTQYDSTVLIVKDFRFEQPNLGKLREEQTKTDIVMGFDQVIEAVDAEGNATAKITINSLKVQIVNKNEEKFAFDSTKEEQKSNPMAALIGQSYTIKLMPDGKASALDTTAAKNIVKSAYEKRIAESLLDDKAVAERHSIPAMPEDGKKLIAVNDSWTKVVPSPPGLLAPKSYAKTYVVKDIKDNIVTVDMTAAESGKAADGGVAGAGGMGMFAKMFDNEDLYTGTMKMDLDSEQVLLSEETLVSSYVAQETPENGDPAKGPDTLLMRFTNTNRLEKVK